MHAIYPKSLDAKDWNASVVAINNQTKAQYTLIDRQLDSIEESQNNIKSSIDLLNESKAKARIWLDFLHDLNYLYKLCKSSQRESTTTSIINSNWQNTYAYTKYGWTR